MPRCRSDPKLESVDHPSSGWVRCRARFRDKVQCAESLKLAVTFNVLSSSCDSSGRTGEGGGGPHERNVHKRPVASSISSYYKKIRSVTLLYK